MFFVVILYGNIKKTFFVFRYHYISNKDFMEGVKLIDVIVVRFI